MEGVGGPNDSCLRKETRAGRTFFIGTMPVENTVEALLPLFRLPVGLPLSNKLLIPGDMRVEAIRVDACIEFVIMLDDCTEDVCCRR